MHDVQTSAAVELGVLQALARIELSVRPRRLVEHLGEYPEHVLVVVEDLVVVAATARVAFHEDRVRSVDHDLPDIVVVEERTERSVTDQIAIGAIGDERCVGELVWPLAPLEFVVPAADLVVDQGTDRCGSLERGSYRAPLFRPGPARACSSMSASGDNSSACSLTRHQFHRTRRMCRASRARWGRPRSWLREPQHCRDAHGREGRGPHVRRHPPDWSVAVCRHEWHRRRGALSETKTGLASPRRAPSSSSAKL